MELKDMVIGGAYEEQVLPGYTVMKVRQRYNEGRMRHKRGAYFIVKIDEIDQAIEQMLEVWDGKGRLDYRTYQEENRDADGFYFWRTIAGEYAPLPQP